jgi:hypothetical protein
MFHVKPAAPALLLGVLLSGAAAFAQSDAGASPEAGVTAPPRPTKRKATSRKANSSGGATAQKSGNTKKGTTSKTTTRKRDPRTIGVGRRCTKRADCSSKAQICLRQQDLHGKPLGHGFCALPCARIEQGLTPTRPGFPARDPKTTDKILKKPPPPRCPPPFKCRSKSPEIPLDLCVRE